MSPIGNSCHFMALAAAWCDSFPNNPTSQVLNRLIVSVLNEPEGMLTVIFEFLYCSTRKFQYAAFMRNHWPSRRTKSITNPLPTDTLEYLPDSNRPTHRNNSARRVIAIHRWSHRCSDASARHLKSIDCPNVRTNTRSTAQLVCDRIWQAVQQHQGNNPQSDDITLVAVSSNLAA
jgi:hypothetical protein